MKNRIINPSFSVFVLDNLRKNKKIDFAIKSILKIELFR